MPVYLTSLFISNKKAANSIIKLPPKTITKFVKYAKVPSDRLSVAKSIPNTNASPRSGRNMFSEK
jgi:hypothetical protein